MVGTFPLNVQAGSPQYTLASEITPSSSTTTITITSTDPIDPISNAYYTIQNEDGSKWSTFYVSQWSTITESGIPTHTGTCTYSSSNTSDVFPEGSVCWCIWCKEYYDSLIAKIGGGNTVKVSQLEWDTNLVIPAGKAIESTSGEVGIVGDVSISGSLSAENTVQGVDEVTSALVTATNTDITNLTVSGYTPKLVQTTGNVITYNGTPNTTIFCATIPQGGVTCNGTITLKIQAGSVPNQAKVYVSCYSFGGKITEILLCTATSFSTQGKAVPITNVSIPEATQFIRDFRVTSDDQIPTITNVNISSATYASKLLI